MNRNKETLKRFPTVISFANLKGGVGKTVTVMNLAATIAEEKKVLLIDNDPQSNLTAALLDEAIGSRKHHMGSIYTSNPEKTPEPEKLVVKSPVQELQNLDCIPAGIEMYEREWDISGQPGRELILTHYFEKHHTFFEEYDYIMIDTNPSMSLININAYMASDHILLITDPTQFALTGTELFCKLWDKVGYKLGLSDNISGIIIAKYDRRVGQSLDAETFARGDRFTAHEIVMDTKTYASADYEKAIGMHKPINIAFPKRESSMQFRKMVDELKEMEVL